MTSGADSPTGSDNHLQFHHWNNSSWDKVFYVHRDFINIPDSKKIGFGDSNDLQIYHNGTNSIISNSTGALKLLLNNDEDALVANQNGTVELYNNNTKRFETSSTGFSTYGTEWLFGASGTVPTIKAGGTNTDIRIAAVGSGGWVAFGTGNGSGGNVDRWKILGGSGHLEPGLNNTYNIGSTTYRVANIYTNDLHLSNEGHSNDVDGTWGNWTIQEGESDLFLKNNRSGKKYKFNLTEVA